MKRRRRKKNNPSAGDVVGVLVALGVPLVVVVGNRISEGRDPFTGKGPPPPPGLGGLGQAIQNALGQFLDPAVYAFAAGAIGATAGIATIVTGWEPGFWRGALLGSVVAEVGAVALVAATRPALLASSTTNVNTSPTAPVNQDAAAGDP